MRTREFSDANIEGTPAQLTLMSLGEFLPALFQALRKECVQFCILRNYEGFPVCNAGRDIDILIRASDLRHAIQALGSIRGIRIVGYSERRYVANVFLQGVSATPESRAIQIDFYLSLTWKGLTYLPTDLVLQGAVPCLSGESTFLVPSPVHGAITSLLASLITGGWLKEKYFPGVQQIFATERSEVIAALLPQFGKKAATRLTDSVIGGRHEDVLECVGALRTSLVVRNLLRRPFHCALAVVRHYARECELRFSPGLLVTVCILSLKSWDSNMIIESLIPALQFTAVAVEKRQLWSQAPRLHDLAKREPVSRNTNALKGRVAFRVKIFLWIVREWMSQLKITPTLRIAVGHPSDLIVSGDSSCAGMPEWAACFLQWILPSPYLWVLLDPAIHEMSSSDHEALTSEVRRQLEFSRSLVKTTGLFVILDSRRPATQVTEDVYSAIVDFLAQRADGQLNDRF